MCEFVLTYELKNGRVVTFEFDLGIDFEKYNKAILSLYGKQIKRRYVVDTENGEAMSLRQLRKLIGGDE